jgi:ferredoxin
MKATIQKESAMSLVLFYFSGTGNTRYIAHRICHTLNNRGYEAQAVSIEGMSIADARTLVDNSSVVGLGWPIYGSDIPAIMKKFIKEMPIVEKKPLLTFCTQMMFSGDGAVVWRSRLEAKGYVQKWAMQINMPNNISLSGVPFKCSDDYAQHEEKYLKLARKKADYLAYKVYNNAEDIKGATVFNTIAALSQRPAFKYFAHSYMIGKLGVSDICNGCGLCADMCPRNVLQIKDGRAFHENKKDCTLCLRCADFCPQSAVTYAGKVKQPLYKGPDKQTYKDIITNKKA